MSRVVCWEPVTSHCHPPHLQTFQAFERILQLFPSIAQLFVRVLFSGLAGLFSGFSGLFLCGARFYCFASGFFGNPGCLFGNARRVFGMEKARDLLTATSLKVAEIAWSCGFTDPGYVTRCHAANTTCRAESR